MKFLTTCVAVIGSVFAPGLRGEPIHYANYGLDERTETTATGVIAEIRYRDGPWGWHSVPDELPAPFWRVNSRVIQEVTFTGPPTFDEELVGTISYVGMSTLEAHEEGDAQSIIGTMVWGLVGAATIDFNASRAIVDEDAGLIKLRVGQPLSPEGQPAEIYTFVEETGVFLDDGIMPVRNPANPDDLADSWLFASGWSHLQLLPGVDVNDPVALQENIFAAPFVGGISEVVWSGYYVPEPSTLFLAAVALATLAFVGLVLLMWRRWQRSRV